MIALLAIGLAVASPVQERLQADPRVVWVGIDCTPLRMFVPEPFDDPSYKVFWGPGGGLTDFVGTFRTAKEAWVRLCGDWNQMFLNERLKPLGEELSALPVVSLAGPMGPTVAPRSDWFTAALLASRVPPTLEATAIADAVRRYRVAETSGVGFVVVAERFAGRRILACVWPTFFDVATRDILHSERMCLKPGGLEFRNYWFNPMAQAAKRSGKSVAKGEW